MNELTNTINVTGTYDDTPIAFSSNSSIVKIIDGLTLTLNADKKYWKDCNLTYTINLNNQTDIKYETITLTDVLDTNYIIFVDGTVEINDVKAQSSEYHYDDETHTLTITLAEVDVQSNATIKFSVKKK